MSLYKFEKVSKLFNSEKVLDDISLEINKGSVVGLIGRNGSGKTTTLKIMANLLIADEGNVYYNNRRITSDDNYLLSDISVFFDPERSLYWRLTGIENLKRILLLKHLKYNNEREKIEYLLKELNMFESKDDYVMNYSKGMKTKILLIACFLGSPKAILLDEPFTGLDYESKNKVIKLFTDYSKKGGTIILTEHSLVDLQRICTKMFWYEKGVIIFRGKPDEILQSIEGEGVIEVVCKDYNMFIEGINSLLLKDISIKQKDEKLYILSNNVVHDFELIKNQCDDYYFSLELHLKGFEDLYIFDKRLNGENNENLS